MPNTNSRRMAGLPSTLAVSLLMVGIGYAQPPGPPAGERGHHGPPPAAFDACQGKQAGDACEVSFGERKVAGKCAAFSDGRLACHPAPPPEFAKACEGKNEGDVCTVQLQDHELKGQCRKDPAGNLSCRPQHKER